MKRYWEYVREYTEKASNIKIGGYAIKLEVWIGFKFLDDNGIKEPWRPEEHEKLNKLLDRCELCERMLFINATRSTFKAAYEIANERKDENDF